LNKEKRKKKKGERRRTQSTKGLLVLTFPAAGMKSWRTGRRKEKKEKEGDGGKMKNLQHVSPITTGAERDPERKKKK